MINENNTMIISDLHLGHKSICKYRTQFATVEDHDETIKENIMMVANKRQKIWILGDIAFTSEAGDWIVDLSKRCNLELVLGNHCSENKERLANIVKYVQSGIKIHGFKSYKDSWLSHCPIHPDEMRKKKINIHGHVHSQNIKLNGVDDKRYFNVSCENIDYKPIRYDEIMGRLL